MVVLRPVLMENRATTVTLARGTILATQEPALGSQLYAISVKLARMEIASRIMFVQA